MKWVLVVDDDRLVAETVAEFVAELGLRSTTAHDALQSFIQARDLKPVLVISDIQMSRFGTGDVTLRELRKDARLAQVPFIFMTGMDLERARALLPSGDPTVRLISKPIDWELLERHIRELTGAGGD